MKLMRSLPIRRARGFTLLEVLVALSVFAVLAVVAWQGLAGLSSVSQAQRARAAEFAELQRLVFTFDADLRQLVSRTGRDRAGRVLPALAGRTDGWIGRRAVPVLDPAGSGLAQVGWRLEGDTLVREVWPQALADPAQAPLAGRRFSDIVDFALRYRAPSGAWSPNWPAAVAPEVVPAAVEYRLVHRQFGEIVRRVVL